MKTYSNKDFTLSKENGINTLITRDNLKTSFGSFKVSITLWDQKINNEILISELNDLIVYFSNHFEDVIDIVYKSYQMGYDENINEIMGFPNNIEKLDVHTIIEEQHLFVESEVGEISKRIYFSIPWDCEHGLYLEPNNTSWEIVDV